MSQVNETEFYIVDFDRTLADADKLLEVFMGVADNYFDIPRDQLEKADADVKARGDSFDTASYVRDHLTEQGRGDEWKELEKRFIHESHSLNYLLPGSDELLRWLDDNDKRYGILTYGNPLWQHLKLSASGFSRVKHVILEHKEKGRLISSWQQKGEVFHIPEELGGGVADRIVMIDDKAVSFVDFPPAPSTGYWVLDPAHELPSQQGLVPENVMRHSNLYTVTTSLDN